jgi:hypothetical protein
MQKADTGYRREMVDGCLKKSVRLFPKSIGLTPNPAQAGFYLRRQMASCILSSSKYFQYLKTLALAGG